MEFEFDDDKRQDALLRHGVDFARAGGGFDGTEFTWIDDRQDYEEVRYNTFGSLSGRLVALTWTVRNERRRIISLRKSNDRETVRYDRAWD